MGRGWVGGVRLVVSGLAFIGQLLLTGLIWLFSPEHVEIPLGWLGSGHLPSAETKLFPASGGIRPFVLLLVFLVVIVLAGLSGKFRNRLRPADARPVDALADLLAQAVRAQLHKAAAERLLVTPAPIPVG